MDLSKKYLYINPDDTSGEVDSSRLYPVSSLEMMGMGGAASSLELAFKDAGSGDISIVDITVTSGKGKEVMQRITEEIAWSKQAIIVVADKSNSEKCSTHIDLGTAPTITEGAGTANVTVIKATTASLTVTAGTATNTLIGVQPANTSIKNLFVIPNSALTTAGADGDDLDFDVGTAAYGGQIIDEKALLDDGGSAVTAAAGTVLAIIDNGRPAGANAFANDGPATSELMALASHGILHTNSARDIYVGFEPQANNLAATGTVDVIIEFVHTS